MADAKQVEIQMTVDTFNLAMGGRLREGHVYKLAPEYADHLMAQGFAITPTKQGRAQTEQTQEEEVAELEARLAALRGDTPPVAITRENMGVASPAPTPPGEQPQPLVTSRSTRRSLASEMASDRVGESSESTTDLTGHTEPSTEGNNAT